MTGTIISSSQREAGYSMLGSWNNEQPGLSMFQRLDIRYSLECTDLHARSIAHITTYRNRVLILDSHEHIFVRLRLDIWKS